MKSSSAGRPRRRSISDRPEATAAAKIADGTQRCWHRMGDVGYFDADGRLWFCGRRAHIVVTENGTMYPVRCEAIFNQHPQIYRSALVGVGEMTETRAGHHRRTGSSTVFRNPKLHGRKWNPS